MSGKKIGRHDKMMAMLADSSDSDAGETPTSKAQTSNKAAKVGAIKPVANPIPTVGKKKALQAQAEKFGAALNDSDDDDFDKPVMAKATPKVINNNNNTKNNDKRKETPIAQPTVDNKKEKVVIAAAAPLKKQHASAPNTTFTIEAATAVQMATSAAKKSTEPTTGKTQKKSLFDDDGEENEQAGGADTFTLSAADTEGLSKKALAAINAPSGSISINKNYADRYDAVKRKQELQQLADKYKLEYDEEESDETDEEEDEHGDALNDEVSDELWAEVFYRLRRNDPTITDKSVGFFKALEEEKKKRAEQSQNKSGGGDESSDDGDESESDGEGGRRRKKRYTLKDEYQRAIIGGESYDETANNLIDEDDRPGKLKPRTAAEKAAKAAFLSAIGGATAAADEEDDDAIIKKKEGGLSSAEIYGDKDKNKKSAKEKKHVSALAEAFSALSNTATDEEKQQEAFLKSFFLNEKWREDGDSDSEDNDNEYIGAGINKKGMKHGDVNWEQLAKEDQDEVFFDEAEQWEREFQNKQFHHEMVDSTEDLQIKSFPRRATLAAAATPNMSTVGSVQISTLKSVAGEQEAALSAVVGGGDGLLRKHESTRKEQRKRRAERAAEAEAQRVEELKRLKTLKRMEIEEKRDMIARVAGFLKGGTNANTNDASLDEFNLENPFAENSSDPKDDKKKSKKNKAVAPVQGNHKLLEQLSTVWSNEELEKDFDSEDFDKKMAALFDTDEFNNDIDEEEIARIRAEIEADGDDFGGDDEDDEGLDAEELAEKLLNEEVDVGFGDENGADGEGLFFTNNAADADDDDEEGNGGILGDDELFGDLKNVLSIDKKKKKTSKAVEEEEDDANELYGSTAATSNAALGATDDDDDLTALLYPTAVLSKMEKEAAAKAQKKEGAVLSISANSKKSDLQAYLGDLQKELDAKVDEYNKLHYDKVLSGGLKTRFRYRSVPAENFGLTDEDILTKDDRTLNMIAPMKLYGAYLGPKENKRDRQRCVARIQNLRQLDPCRRSRRYGDVAKTILFDTGVSEEEGKALAARVRLSTRKLLVNNDAEEVAVEAEEELKKLRKAKKEEAKSKSKSGDDETAAASGGGAQKRPRDSATEERGGFRGRGRGAGFHRGGSSSDRGGPRFERDNNNNNNFGGRGNNFGSGGNGGRGGFGASGRGGGGSFRGGNNNSFGRGGFTPRGGRGGNQQK